MIQHAQCTKQQFPTRNVLMHNDFVLQEFYGEVKEQDRINEVNRILGAFKLNPFEQLGTNFDANREDIKRQYRKVSLLVHPDKCSHPRAGDAFDILGQAQAALLEDDRFKELQYIVNMARGEAELNPATTILCKNNLHIQKLASCPLVWALCLP